MRELATVSLVSEQAEVVVIPELGGRTAELRDLLRGRQWLWRNDRTAVGPVRAGTAYDDVWQGGFEELFPNDAPSAGERNLPDHGELWSIPWELTEASQSSLTLQTVGPSTGTTVTKSLRLDGPELTIRYRLDPPPSARFPYLFKLHPAFEVNDHCRIELPPGIVEKVSPDFGDLLDSADRQAWPTVAQLDRCRSASSSTHEFIYVSEMERGTCGISDMSRGARVDLTYSTDDFPYCWLFITYGGWMGHNVVVLEPCTNYPKDLDEAVKRGTSASFVEGESKEYNVKVTLGALSG